MISRDLLREARLRAGLTQAELARRAGTTQPAIARYERGKVEPSLERLRELIRACGLELTFGLATYDDSYVEHIQRQLKLSPLERVTRMSEFATQLEPWIAAAEAARRG